MADELTVILARPLPIADGVASVARAWSRLGLLDPMVWVDSSEPFGKVGGELIVRGESIRAMSLGEALSSAPYKRIKLISARLAVSEGAFDVDSVNAELARIERVVEDRLANGIQELTRLNLIIPVADLVRLPSELVVRQWDTNVVVAPEDRVDPRYADRGVHENHDYFGHAMAAIAANGGLWSGLGDPLSSLRTSQGSQRGVVRVSRSYARAIFGDDVTGSIAEGTVSALSDLSIVSAWRGIAVDENPRLAVVQTAERFVMEHPQGFKYEAPSVSAQGGQRRTSGLKAVKALLNFVWMRIQGVPDRLVSRAKEAIISKYESVVQAATYGSDSAYVVKVGDREIPKDIPNVEIPDAAYLLLDRLGLDSAAGATSNDWDELRRQCLELVDPEGTGKRSDRMLVDTDDIVGAIGRPAMVDGQMPSFMGNEFRPAYETQAWAADPAGVRELLEAIDIAIEAHLKTIKDVSKELKSARERERTMRSRRGQKPLPVGIEVLTEEDTVDEPRLRRWSRSLRRRPKAELQLDPEIVVNDDSPGESAVTGPDDEQVVFEAQILELTSEIELLEARVKSLETEVETMRGVSRDIDRWREEQRRAVAWRVGEHLDTEIQKAFGDFKSCIEEIGNRASKEPESLEQSADRRIRWSGLGAGLVSIGGVVGAVLSTLLYLVLLPISIVVWIGYSLLQMWKLFQDLNRRDDAESRYEAALRRLPLTASQVVKLEDVYRQFLGWADLVSSMVHPTIAPAAPTQDLDLDVVARPAACQFVEVESDRAGRSGAISRTGRKMFATGWTNRMYTIELNAAVDALAIELGLTPLAIDSSPFSGVHQARLRALMNESFSSGAAVDRWRSLALSTVAEEVGADSISALFPSVESEGVVETSEEFFGHLKPIASDGVPEYFGLAPWSPTGLVDGSTRIEDHIVIGPVALTDPIDGADYIAMMTRLDISGAVFDSQLKVFPRSDSQAAASVQLDPSELG